MWNDLIQAISASKDALATIFAAVAIIVSILGLRAWRNQVTGRAEYDLARRLLLAVFRARDAVNALRSPFIGGEEMAEAAKGVYEADGDMCGAADNPARLAEIAYGRRWERVREALAALAAEQIEAKLLWSRGAEEKLQPFHDCIFELHASLEQYLALRRGDSDASEEEQEKTRRIVLRNWGAAKSRRKDEFGERFEAAVKRVELALKPFLDLR